MVDVDGQAGEIIAIIHWKGGVHTELRIPRRRRGYNRAHSPKEIVDAVGVLVRICSDDAIAGALSRSGLVTGRGNRWCNPPRLIPPPQASFLKLGLQGAEV